MKPYRNKKYLKWVKSLPCVCCGQSPSDPHHTKKKGLSGVGTTASDLFAFPLCRYHHRMFHDDPMQWEEDYGNQWRHVVATLSMAFFYGELDDDLVLAEIKSQVTNVDDKWYLINELT